MFGDVRETLGTDEERCRLDERRETHDRAIRNGWDRRLRGE